MTPSAPPVDPRTAPPEWQPAAPSALRAAISSRRATPRISSRQATFEQVISSTMAMAPITIANSRRRRSTR